MKAFLTHYYGMFETNREALAGFFDGNSIFTFESDVLLGQQNIIKHLIGLPFKTVKFIPSTVDTHPTIYNGYFTTVVGQLKTDDDPPHGFAQSFHVKVDGQNPIILNSVFRLNIHNG